LAAQRRDPTFPRNDWLLCSGNTVGDYGTSRHICCHCAAIDKAMELHRPHHFVDPGMLLILDRPGRRVRGNSTPESSIPCMLTRLESHRANFLHV